MAEFLVGGGLLLALKYVQAKIQAPATAAPVANAVKTPAGSVIAPAQGFSPTTPSTAAVTPVSELRRVRNIWVVGDPSVAAPAAAAGSTDDPVTGPVGLCLKPYDASSEPGRVLAPSAGTEEMRLYLLSRGMVL